MGRPTTIQDEQILRAAQQVFLQKGIRATTAEVARRAGVAEGSIFKRWPTKQELFHAAMRAELEEPEWLALLHRSGAQDLQRTLYEVGLEALRFMQRLLPLMMMSWSNPTRRGVPAHLEGINSPPLRALGRLANFFEAQIRAGHMRKQEPEIFARAFLGGIQNYAFFELLSRANDQEPMLAEDFVRGLVKLLWHGAEPRVLGKKKGETS
jgi:AcrR family transcriptional regulator